MTYTNHDPLTTATWRSAVAIVSTPIGFFMLRKPLRSASQIRKEVLR